MKIIAWNSFVGYYVVSNNPKSFDGLRFHFWGTFEECEEYVKKNAKPLQVKLNV